MVRRCNPNPAPIQDRRRQQEERPKHEKPRQRSQPMLR